MARYLEDPAHRADRRLPPGYRFYHILRHPTRHCCPVKLDGKVIVSAYWSQRWSAHVYTDAATGRDTSRIVHPTPRHWLAITVTVSLVVALTSAFDRDTAVFCTVKGPVYAAPLGNSALTTILQSCGGDHACVGFAVGVRVVQRSHAIPRNIRKTVPLGGQTAQGVSNVSARPVLLVRMLSGYDRTGIDRRDGHARQ